MLDKSKVKAGEEMELGLISESASDYPGGN